MTRPAAFTLPGLTAGLVVVLGLGCGILLGSRNLRNYDPTLLIYTFGALFSAFAMTYRYTMWLQRPPTRVYWRRSWQLLWQRQGVGRHLLTLAWALGSNFIAQRFILQRGRSRWLAHFCMSWGTILAGAVTFPLVFGWIHFASQANAPQVYQVLVFGIRIGAFHTEVSWIRYVFFNLLNLAAVMVLVGVVLTLHRRLKDTGAVAAQQFGNDLVPLLLLLAVSATGLMLTLSMHTLHGAGYVVISLIHAGTVIATLLYLPFGKLFHLLQRPLHLGVTLYKQANTTAPPAVCRLCGEGFAGAMHVEDLKGVLTEVGLDWHLRGPAGHYMHVCPRCRRRQVGIWHARAMAPTVRPSVPSGATASAQGEALSPASATAEGRQLNVAPSLRDRVRVRGFMMMPPQTLAQLTEQYGPHLHDTPPGGWQGRGEPDRLVKTHCCFCGVQCGIQLKVKENTVIGFEPWEEFPVNRGMLCPKGVKRYLQGSHPDRLLTPLIRSTDRFREADWPEALNHVEDHIRRIQAQHGRDAFALLSGASLTNEKAYLIGKFARLALRTKNIDYNGRLCMVSAGAANRMAFGIDRGGQPWSDIPLAKCLILAGINVGECFPILTDYIWRARDNGARIIVIDPRMTPIARTADLLLPVRPGRDSALMNGLLHVCIARGWTDHAFIAQHTQGFDKVQETVADYTPERVAALTGVPAAAIIQAAEWWGTAPTAMLLHARGIEHHTQGTENCLACINLVLATGKMGKPGCGYSTITGQGNGQGGREHGQRCNQLPSGRDIDNPEHRRIVAERWGVAEDELPGVGYTATEMREAIHRGEIRGLLCICFNPLVSLPDAEYTRAALERLEFFCVIDFFMSETARYADVILPGSLQEEDEGTVTNAEGRVIRIRQAVQPPGKARPDWEIVCDLARRLAPWKQFPYACVEDIFRELRRVSRGGVCDYYGITYEKIDQQHGVFWPCPEPTHPGTPRLFDGGTFYHADGKARFHAVEYRPPAEDIDAEYPVLLTTGRVVSQYLSGTQTRRIGPLVRQYPEPLLEIHPDLATPLGVQTGDRVRVVSRRGAMTLPCQVVRTIRPDTVFIPYHWPDERSANLLTIRALDPISKIPAFKVCAVRLEKVVA